jgi:hypothetical protein
MEVVSEHLEEFELLDCDFTSKFVKKAPNELVSPHDFVEKEI